jgi:hypothetical protein
LPPDEALALQTVPEDLNADGIVNAADLATFTADWKAFKAGGDPKARSDFNKDGEIDATDSARILQFLAYCQEHGAYTKAVGRADVGAAGGTLKGPGFQLTVPKGAFSAAARLVLYRLPQPPDPGVGYASERYEVQGLPEAFSKALTVSLTPAPGSPTDGVSFVRMLEPGFAKGGARGDPAAVLLPASPSGGRLTAEIPPIPDAGAGIDDPAAPAWTTSVYSLLRGLRQLDSAHFRFIYSKRIGDETVGRLSEFAEAAYTQLATAYNLSWARRTRWPVEIEVTPLDGTLWGLTSIGPRGVDYVSIQMNSIYAYAPGDLNRLGAATGHEVFHVMQALYDPRSRWSMASRGGAWLWFDEATAVDMEFRLGSMFTPPGQPLPIPTAVFDAKDESSDNWAFPSNHGLEFPDTESRSNAQEHGYGASMFVHDRLTAWHVGQLYQAHYAGLTGPCTTLADFWGSSAGLGYEYTSFVSHWLGGSVYSVPGSAGPTPFPQPGMLLGTRATGCIINFGKAPRPIGATLTRNVQDLSVWSVVLRPDPAAAGLPPPEPGSGGIPGRYNHRVSGIMQTADPNDFALQLWFAKAGKWTNYGSSYACSGRIEFPMRSPDPAMNMMGGTILLTLINHTASPPYTARTPVTLGFQPYPELAGIEPSSGPRGTSFVVRGCCFGTTPGLLTWGGAPIPSSGWSPTEVSGTVPDWATPWRYGVNIVVPGPGTPSGQAGLYGDGVSFDVTEQ